MSKRPQDTSAEEPEGGNPHIRFRGGPGRGNSLGLLNKIGVGPLAGVLRLNKKGWQFLLGLCAIMMVFAWGAPARAQSAEVKDKPRLYTYEAFWVVPRNKWTEFEKANPAEQKVLDKAIAGGVLVSYGSDSAVLHDAEGPTHDNWWQAMSMAGTLTVLDDLEKVGGSSASVLNSATKHWDNMWVSRFYNWHAGSWQGAYSYAAIYTLKTDAPGDAVDMLAKNMLVPLLEKLLADGTIVEYEIDEQAVHSDAPGLFVIDLITPTAEGLDKVHAAIRAAGKSSPLSGQALGSMVDFAKHRDSLTRVTATYK